MKRIEQINKDGIAPEISRPSPELVLAGDPVHTTWSVEERGNLFCGVWETTPGKWKVNYSEWEYIYIHVGHSVLTDSDGNATHLMSGDSYVIRPGFVGTWEAIETTLKDYVIIT